MFVQMSNVAINPIRVFIDRLRVLSFCHGVLSISSLLVLPCNVVLLHIISEIVQGKVTCWYRDAAGLPSNQNPNCQWCFLQLSS